ncbi:hypothetical protein M378DRAFT_25969 [Amanita muscaria Koide BX008]|uniref:Uncharacterized protein n=1 Tax=Amanita muscaria (strain Koide BX008) TaxID=946122 RepID=A0A0C2T522_AMAMK|nr:hypothetical protein M378DRAFT_25969 [Amanita muscaria Koide BX008]
MSLLLVATLVASSAPQQLHPPLPVFPSGNLPVPQPPGSIVGFVHEKKQHFGVTSGSDNKGHYNIVPFVHRQGQSDLLQEVVVKAHPFDVHHTGHVNPELGAVLKEEHRQIPPSFVIHPTEPHPKSVNHQVAAHLAAGANGGHRGVGGHGRS